MKISKTRIEKYQRTLNLLKSAEQLFALYPADAARLTEFENKLNEAVSAYSNSLIPASVYQKQLRDQRELLRTEAVNLIERGLAVAGELNDVLMLETLRAYSRQSKRAATYELLQITELVCKSLTDHQSAADALGLTASYIAAVRNKLQSFSNQQEQKTRLYAGRKVDRAKLNVLLHELHVMLLLYIDPAVTMHTQQQGDFYAQWKNLRAVVRHRKKAASTSQLSNVIGTVTDAATGKAVAGALITVVEQQGVATSDADGMYLIEGLLPGWITIGCMATGYAVPVNQRYEIHENEELEVDIELQSSSASAA